MLSLFIVSTLIASGFCQTITFNNITAPSNLSELFDFTAATNEQLEAGICTITNYVDIKKNNQTYFHLTQSIFSADDKHNDVIDAIYDSDLKHSGHGTYVYYGVISKADEGMSSCTSPLLSNDIIQCNIKIGCFPSNDCTYIECRRFVNNFMHPQFPVSGRLRVPGNYIKAFDVLCFNDSYLILWSMESKPPISYYYSVIDVNGNLLHDNVSYFGADESATDFTLSAYTKSIQGIPTDFFLLQSLLLNGNGVEISNVISNYTNYTPNYMNGIIATIPNAQNGAVWDSFTAPLNATDPFNALCCYVTTFWSCDGATCGVYLSLNDFDGEIGIVQLVDDSGEVTKTFPVIKELRVYNKDDEDHYFVVIYLNGNNNVQGTVYNLNDQRKLLKLNTVVFNNVSSSNMDSLMWLCAEIIDNGLTENLMIVESWKIYNEETMETNPGIFGQTYNVTLNK